MSLYAKCAVLSALLTLGVGAVSAQEFGGLVEGEGRVETFANCTPCHSAMLIRQQRHDRRTWNEIIDWMRDYQGMHALEAETRDKIVSYLVEHYGPEE